MEDDEKWQWTVSGLLAHAEIEFSERAALLAAGRPRLVYARLGAFCRSMRQELRDHGFSPQARIAVALSGGAEMTTAFLSVASGAAFMPLPGGCPQAEATRYLTLAHAEAVMIEQGAATGLRAAASDLGLAIIDVTVDPSAPAGLFTCTMPVAGQAQRPQLPDREGIALLLLTSGSTGASKLVELTNGNICFSARQMALALCLQPDDRCLNIMPLTHIAGLGNVVLSSVVAGASIVCTDSFRATRFFDLMDEYAPTWYTATPAMHRAILDVARSRRDVISAHPFRFVRTSAAPCPVTLIDELEQCFGVPVVNHYGLTETGPLVSANPLPPGKRKRGAVGLPAGCEVAIMGAGGTLQEHTTVGQVVVRGPNVMPQRDELGRSGAFVDGWFCTGDEGYLDAEGYLFLTGRLGDHINRGGENISPAEIEDALLTHPSVRQAAAFGVPDVVLGQDVAAAVVLADGEHTAASELRSFAAQLLSASKVPTQLLILKDLPMTSSGKVLRRELVEMAKHLQSTAAADVGSDVARDDRMMRLRELLLSIWRDVLGIAEVGPDDDFLMLGGDSTDVTRFITRVREMSGCSVGYAEVFEHRTVSRLAELLKERVTLPSAGSATP